MTFAITGMGRSGTKYLAQVLNLSPTWAVLHEPVGAFQHVRDIQQRFASSLCPNYGECNSYLRMAIVALDVDAKLVIVREPMDIFQSMFNRGRPRLEHLNESLYVLDGAIQSGVPAVSFRQVVADPRSVGRIVGVTDIPDSIQGAGKNASRSKQMPSDLRRKATNRLAWFTREYRELLSKRVEI